MAFQLVGAERMGCLTQIQWAAQKAVALVKINSGVAVVVIVAAVIAAAVTVAAAAAVVVLVVVASGATVAGVTILPAALVVVPAVVPAAVEGGTLVVDADTQLERLLVQLVVDTG